MQCLSKQQYDKWEVIIKLILINIAMKRITIIYGLISLMALSITQCNNRVQHERPNLLFILADDLTKRDLGCFGSPDAITPNIDRLASEGIRFNSCFSAVAMCAPLRMQLYTGLHPVRSGAWPNHSKVYPYVKSIFHYLEPLDYRVGLSGKRHIQPLENFPFDEVQPGPDGNGLLEYMNAGDDPFVLFVCSNEPHCPWNKGDSSLFNPDLLHLYKDQVDTPEFRRALCRYFAEIQFLDNQVGEAIAALKESGKENNTIVMFATEQGASVPGAKWTLYDAGIQAGLIVKWPRHVAAGNQSEALVNYIDILPTFLDIVGSNQPDLDGNSFLDVLLGKTTSHSRYIYGIHTQKGAIASPEYGYPIRSIRNNRYALIKNLRNDQTFSNALTYRDREHFWQSWLNRARSDTVANSLVERYLHRSKVEFYDLAADPLQLTNLIDDAEYDEIIREMDRALSAWMEKQGDEGGGTEDLAYMRNHKYIN